MNKKRKAVLAFPIIAILIGVGYLFILGIPIGFATPTLEFPILETHRIERLSAYHTPNWGEPGVFHNGIDLVISDDVTVVSPVRGTVLWMSENINPYAGNVLFDITIAVNLGWYISLVLEPGFMDATNNSLQSNMIDAEVGQRVEPGDELGTLLFSGNYPHLHYMLSSFGSNVCAYNYSSFSARSTFESIALASNSTILYPHDPPNVLLSPMVTIPVALGLGYALVAIVVFRRN